MSKNSFKVSLNCPSTQARLGELKLLHGTVQTPIFLPVGTQATVRSLTPGDLEQMEIRMILCNAYHLYLRPGIEIIRRAAGLHKFMHWDRPILTDSGGYQIFSLSSFRNITDDGVSFKSHIDGSEHHITPESAVLMQEELGADIIMVLDVCPESTAKKDHLVNAMEYTARWAERCLKAKQENGQLLFGIIQGGTYPELREKSAAQLTPLDFPGYAIGGLSLGEPKAEMWSTVDCTVKYMPAGKPRYLMGVGSPEDIVEGIAKGIDIFDCALPTRVARNGALFTRAGRKNIKRSCYKDSMSPVEEGCGCYTCSNFTAAYLHHLFKCEELLAYRLATIHNLYFMNRLVLDIREAIGKGHYAAFKDAFLESYQTTDEERRIEQKLRGLEIKKDRGTADFQ
jgi:queuine tRNA-ribosyltransferase